MELYLTGLITGILLTVSATMFLGASTVNVKKKNLGHIVVNQLHFKMNTEAAIFTQVQ